MKPLHERTFDYNHAWTAICVFEWMDMVTTPNEKWSNPDWINYRENNGVCQLRDDALSLAEFVNLVVAKIPDDTRDINCFDWEIVPAIMETIGVTPTGVLAPSIISAAERATDELDFSTYLSMSNQELKHRYGINFLEDAGLSRDEFRSRFWPKTMEPKELATWWGEKYGLTLTPGYR